MCIRDRDNILKNGDYFSFIVHLSQKKHYDLGHVCESQDTFLEGIMAQYIKKSLPGEFAGLVFCLLYTSCGGVLATLSLKGYKIVTVAMTGGERGNPPNMSVSEYREQKVKEAEKFAKILGGEAVVLPYADGELPDTQEVRMQLCDLIRQYRCLLYTSRCV